MLLKSSFPCAVVVQDLKASFEVFLTNEEAQNDVVVCKVECRQTQNGGH